MNEDLFNAGLSVRREVLGREYVGNAINVQSELELEFQNLITEFCWGTIWTDDRLDRSTKSLVVLAITGALGRDPEFKLHLQGAINNGVSEEQLVALIKQLTVYAGVPAGVSAMHAFREVLRNDSTEPSTEKIDTA